MPGTVHIFRVDPSGERLQPEYQINYDTAGIAYSKVYTERKLKEVLQHPVDLDAEQVERVLRDLRRREKVTLPDIELTSEEINGLEMEPLPTDV